MDIHIQSNSTQEKFRFDQKKKKKTEIEIERTEKARGWREKERDINKEMKTVQGSMINLLRKGKKKPHLSSKWE